MNQQQRIWQLLTCGVAPMELWMRAVRTIEGQDTVAWRSVTGINSVELGTLFPEQYWPVAARSGLLVRLVQWNLSQVLERMSAWGARSEAHVDIHVLVPADMLKQHQLEHFLKQRVGGGFGKIGNLCLEFTPDLLLAEKKETVFLLERLRAMGAKLSIVGLGSEYCPILRLNGLPIEKIVLDRSFVTYLERNDAKMIEGVLSLARATGAEIILDTAKDEVMGQARQYGVDCYTLDVWKKINEVIGD